MVLGCECYAELVFVDQVGDIHHRVRQAADGVDQDGCDGAEDAEHGVDSLDSGTVAV